MMESDKINVGGDKLGAALGKNKMGRGEVDNARFAQARAPPRPPPRARELRGRPRYRGKR